MFVALYLPVLPPNMTKNPSISGFSTQECAWDYIYSQMCSWCKEEREAALRGDKEWGEECEDEDGNKWKDIPSLHPACSCEWDVIPHENFTEAELAEFE